ncbi:MAG: hypothetical protein HYX64_07760 [Gammaproteobacteria bacterium]|nr:hypothetical protein [Gammaproteobacteria bacterium]
MARTLMRPEVGAASAIELWQKDTHDVNALTAELSAQVQAVNGGDLRRAEAMLISQAHTLNDVFNILLRRVTAQTGLLQWEAHMRAAMRAQSQCRMTLEALAEMKNPKAIAFVRQANIANGPQQVNNGTHAHAGEKPTPQPELLERQHGEWMDSGATSATSTAHQEWRPWEQSTGPRSEAGKAVASRNGWKGGERPMLRELARILREQASTLAGLDVN